MAGERLRVIALISGGKDSFYGLLHCLHHGHDVVALANLFPPGRGAAARPQAFQPGESPPGRGGDDDPPAEPDLNSFMYQTVGHQLMALYATATGIPLYRQPIVGRAECHDRDYDPAATGPAVVVDDDDDDDDDDDPAAASSARTDETEAMVPLLRAIKARHPEANALCSGAILSTYQRTRVESVALRLGLVPLSYLWKYTLLPPPPGPPLGQRVADDAQLLRDMAAAGLDARVVKVASAGLDETHLWERATSEDGLGRLGRALRRFGAAPGAVLGEGGEFETLVLDGPAPLFKKRIVVPEAGRSVVSDGGGSLWLMLRGASLEDKADDGPRGQTPTVREPPLLDARFEAILSSVTAGAEHATAEPGADGRWLALARGPAATLTGAGELLQWSVVADAGVAGRSIEAETALVVDKIRKALSSASRDASQITNTLIVLRRMADFSAVNEEYGKLFARPIPPSRVTVSCGDLLPPGRNVLVFVSMPRAAVARGDRSGLHVQARSYWAPANIGPYSQAVDVPVTARTRATGLRAVYVAGQIPLVPASMTLPPPSCAASLQKQIVLSLQHLWRIGAEMKVQCWTSAVAYFARASPSSSSPAEAMERRARQACRAWALAHAAPDEDEAEAEVGPDPWHLRYNHEYMTLGGADAQSSTVALPDWSIFTMRQQNAPESCIPPVFAAEVQGLPRQSAVEWHAHVGLAHVPDGCAEMMRRPEVGGRRDWSAWHAVVRTAEASLVYTALARRPVDDEPAGSGDLEQALREAYRQSVRDICPEATAISSLDGPCLVYVDVAQAATPWKGAGDWDGQMPFALVPCHSIWSPEAGRLACLALFRADLVAASQ